MLPALGEQHLHEECGVGRLPLDVHAVQELHTPLKVNMGQKLVTPCGIREWVKKKCSQPAES